MSEVYIHHTRGFWLVTSDGCSLVEKRDHIMLSDVRFVIDPVGQEGARRRQAPSTHAWAVGTPIFGVMQHRAGWLPLRYRWHADWEFETIAGEAAMNTEWYAIRSAKYLLANLDDAGGCAASIAGPERGTAERRRVQQYGWEPRES